jgi:hypothetical protein
LNRLQSHHHNIITQHDLLGLFLFNKTTFLKLSLAIILIPIGLLTKVYSGIGSEFVTNYLGGVIYVVFFIVLASLVFPKVNPLKISLFVLGFACLIEVSQLIQNDLLKDLRTHFLIRILMGSVFNIFDFVFYFVGALIGYGILMGLKNRTKGRGNCYGKYSRTE